MWYLGGAIFSFFLILVTTYFVPNPIVGTLIDYDIVEIDQTFVGVHKIIFNSTNNLPLSCIHVIAQGTNKMDIVQRTAFVFPVEQEIVLSSEYGICLPFKSSPFVEKFQALCYVITVVCLAIEIFSSFDHKQTVLPVSSIGHKTDPRMKIHMEPLTYTPDTTGDKNV
jgi:hypothetical protein